MSKSNYTIGISGDGQYVLLNVPASGPGDAVQHPPFTLLLTPEQAFALGNLILDAAAMCTDGPVTEQ